MRRLLMFGLGVVSLLGGSMCCAIGLAELAYAVTGNDTTAITID